MSGRISDIEHFAESIKITQEAVEKLPGLFAWILEHGAQIAAGGDNAHLLITPHETGLQRCVALKLQESVQYLEAVRKAYNDIMKGAEQ